MKRCSMFALAALLAACGGEPDKPKPAPGTFKAAIVFDIGGIGDKSFNDAAHRGLLRAQKELGVSVEYYEPKEAADRESGLRRFAAKRFGIVLGIGFMFSDEMNTMAGEFPDLKFGCIDYAPKEGKTMPENLVGLKFKEEEGSFLVGAIAALVSKSHKVGFIGGMNVPLIKKFEAGYKAGVKQVAPETEVMVNYAGDTPDAFKDASKGKSMTLGQIEKGADVIFHASGQTGRGVFEAAGEKNVLAIGVDSDQYGEAPGHVLTSMIKKVDVAVFDAIKDAKEGKFKGGLRHFGLKEDGVGYVLDDRNKALIPADVVKKVEALKADIIAGKIKVPSTVAP